MEIGLRAFSTPYSSERKTLQPLGLAQMEKYEE